MGKSAKIHDITKIQERKAPKVMHEKFLSPFDEMSQLMDRMFFRNWLWPGMLNRPLFQPADWQMEDRMPAVDIVDHDDELLIRAELPGVQKDQLDVSLQEDLLTIKTSTKEEKTEEKSHYYRSEITSGTFSRTLSLPCAVDIAKVKSSFKDGVLELVLPKLVKAQKHTIKVE